MQLPRGGNSAAGWVNPGTSRRTWIRLMMLLRRAGCDGPGRRHIAAERMCTSPVPTSIAGSVLMVIVDKVSAVAAVS